MKRLTESDRGAHLQPPKAFWADLRHELRTPLNAVIGYSEILIEDTMETGGHPLTPGLETIHNAGIRLLDLVQEVLDPRKIDAGQMEPDLDCFREDLRAKLQPPARLVTETAERLAAEASAQGSNSFTSDLEKITLAGERFMAMIAGGAGTGHIWEKAVDSSTAAPTRGGQQSANKLDADNAAAAASGHPDPVKFERHPLLVVDDNAQNRDMLKRHLKRQGHRVLTARSGADAMKTIVRHPVDLVLLDIKMPEMDGFQVLHRLKKNKAWRHLPVIMISALDDMDSVVRCIEMGAEDYLTKPFDPVLLKARIGACLEKKRLREKEVSVMKARLEVADTIVGGIKRTISDVVAGAPRDHNFEWLIPHMAEETFSKGDYVFRKGDRADGMYYLHAGRLRLPELDLELESGSIIGETEILSPQKVRPSSAICAVDCRIFALQEQAAVNLFYEKPELLFELIQVSIHRTIANLTATVSAKERIETDLRVANDIQQSLLPRTFPPFPHRKEFDIFATMEAAREVGGDFFDFFFIDQDKLCFVIGDVSGKGVPAALFMAIIKTIIKAEALRGYSPAQILSNANNIIAPDNPTTMFATVLCAILDSRSGDLEYANAGHNPPLIYQDGVDFQFHELPMSFVLGPMENTRFSSGKMVLNRNEVVFFYTDGVTEAMNPEGRFYSEERLKRCLDTSKARTVTEMIQGVREDITGFARSAPQSDDITMLALQYCGQPER